MDGVNIDGTDAKAYHALLLSKSISPSKVTIYENWTRQGLVPQYYGKKETYADIKLVFMIRDHSREACLIDTSNLVRALEKCTLKFPDINLFYDATLTGTEPEYIDDSNYQVSVSLQSGYAYQLPERITFTGSITFAARGNLPASAVVTIQPSFYIDRLQLSGLTKKPITIQHLHTGSPVTIDGETGLVTEPDLDTIITESSGAGKWLYRKYSMAEFFSPGAYSPNYAPQKADIPTNSISMQELISDRRDLMHDTGYDYLGYLKTAVYVSEATSVSWRVSHDDGCSILVNGNTVYSAGVWRRPTVSLPLTAGWNTVEILWIQHLGDGGFWGTQPLLSALVDQLNCYHARDASGDQRVNKFSDTDLWAFPVVQPGKNTVSVDSPDCTVKVEYKPKFM
jgi:phage-related protein